MLRTPLFLPETTFQPSDLASIKAVPALISATDACIDVQVHHIFIAGNLPLRNTSFYTYFPKFIIINKVSIFFSYKYSIKDEGLLVNFADKANLAVLVYSNIKYCKINFKYIYSEQMKCTFHYKKLKHLHRLHQECAYELRHINFI